MSASLRRRRSSSALERPLTINTRVSQYPGEDKFSRLQQAARCKLRAFSGAFFFLSIFSLREAMYPDSPVSAKHNVLAGEEAVLRGDISCTSPVARCRRCSV